MADVGMVVAAIDRVIQECEVSQLASWDSVVGAEMAALVEVRGWVLEEWPLPEALRERVNVGPVAAKNIADWNPGLAKSLMEAHSLLRDSY